MKKLLSFGVGLVVAVLLGVLYVKFSTPGDQVATAVLPDSASGGSDRWQLIGIVAFCWLTAYLPLPGWLSVLLGWAVVWVGTAFILVGGIFVYMLYPNNIWTDGSNFAFLCGIAMVASRFASVLRYMQRRGPSMDV